MKLKKVFCIGFHKTGTSSMAKAFQKLGYRVTGPNSVRDPNIGTNAIDMIEKLVNDFDFFHLVEHSYFSHCTPTFLPESDSAAGLVG